MSRSGQDFSPERLELLAQLLAQAGVAPAQPARIVPRPHSGNADTSFTQERVWRQSQADPAGNRYNNPAAFLLKGSLDLPALQRSFQEIVRRHEICRTVFPDARIQRILPYREIEIQVRPLEDLPEDQQEAVALELATAFARQPLDLTRGPLLKIELVRFGPNRHLLLLLAHHLIADGWSTALLLDELATLYRAFSAGQPSPLVEPELQYADFAAWQRETLDDARLSPALAYWQNRLKNAVPPPSFPHHHRPLPADTVPGAGLRFSWAGNLLKELREYVQPAGMSLFIPLLATYKALLFLYTGEPGILVCSPVASRTRVELEKMPGCFVNLLPLGSALSLTAGFQEALERVRETCLEAYQHQEYPFEQLLEKVLPPAEEGAYTRYMFELTNTPTRSQLNLPGLVVQPLLLERGTARHDLQLIFEERGDKLAGWLVYKTALFTPENARQILQDYRSLLETGLKNPHASLERLAELAGIRRSR